MNRTPIITNNKKIIGEPMPERIEANSQPLHSEEMIHKQRHHPENEDNSDATTCASESTSRTDSVVTSTQKSSFSFVSRFFSRMARRKRTERGKSKKVKDTSSGDNSELQNLIRPKEQCASPILEKPMRPTSVDQERRSNSTRSSSSSRRKRVPSAVDFSSINSGAYPKCSTPMITTAFSDVRVKYHVGAQPIGRGHYGIVRKCMNRETKEWFAIKSIKKTKVKNPKVLRTEIEILLDVNHPNIIRIIDVHEDLKYVHIVTELCTGGELFDRIVDQKDGRFKEKDAIKVLKSILDAVAYCHERNITHRDLKPENFLFETEAMDSPIKIIDFGLSTREVGILKTRVGTAYYIAPEVLERYYTRSCDIWSIGVIAYILLCGYPPFYGDTNTEIFERVKRGTYDFPRKDWDGISQDAKDFVCFLLQKDPAKRPSAEEALNHKWLRTH